MDELNWTNSYNISYFFSLINTNASSKFKSILKFKSPKIIQFSISLNVKYPS